MVMLKANYNTKVTKSTRDAVLAEIGCARVRHGKSVAVAAIITRGGCPIDRESVQDVSIQFRMHPGLASQADCTASICS